MRVTDLTKQTAVLRNIQNNAEQLQNLQETMASGRRINRLSDDPVGATQALDFRTKLSFFEMLKRITGQTFIWMDRTEAELTHIGDLLGRAKTLVLAQANDSADAASRRVTGEELNAIIEALRQSGNAKIGKIFIFAGSRTLSEPLGKNPELQDAVVRTENLEPDVQFLANPEQFQARFEGNSVHPYVVRIVQTGEVGRAHYVVSDDDGATWSREMTLLPTIEVVNEDGQPNDKVKMTLTGNEADKLGEPRIYPAGLEFRYEPSPPVVYLGNDDKRRIPTSEGHLQSINTTAREIFFRNEQDPNSLNVFDLLYSLKGALEDNDPAPLHDRLADLDAAFDQVLNRRADIGAGRKELEDQLAKVQDREFTSTRQLSELEDLNFPAAVMEMNLADVRNRASLDTSARMVQPSLLNFLR